MTFDRETAERLVAEAMADDAAMTPAPWRQCSASDGKCACGLVWSQPADHPVLMAHRGDPQGIPCNADTAGIARTRNNLKAMAEQLKAATQWIDDLLAGRRVDDAQYSAIHKERDELEDDRDRLRAAITKIDIAEAAERWCLSARLSELKQLATEAIEIAEALDNYVPKFPPVGGPTSMQRRLAAIKAAVKGDSE